MSTLEFRGSEPQQVFQSYGVFSPCGLWDLHSSRARETSGLPGLSAPRTAPAGEGAGRTQRRHDARSLPGARSRAAGAAASCDPGNWLGKPSTPCAQPLTCGFLDCAAARTRRPGERGGLATPGLCNSSIPAFSGTVPLLSGPREPLSGVLSRAPSAVAGVGE